MRLWHQNLIPYLDRQHLLGQHRECCALRGKGWGKKHATVDYVFEHDPFDLFRYHMIVINEMDGRGYNVDDQREDYGYRGKTIGYSPLPHIDFWWKFSTQKNIYPEHDRAYLLECLDLLKQKNAPMDFEKIEKELL